jgi:hypothetical protein
VNDNTRIFAPAFEKSMRSLSSEKEVPKKSRIPFDKKLQRCIFAVLQKNSVLKTHRNKHKKF